MSRTHTEIIDGPTLHSMLAEGTHGYSEEERAELLGLDLGENGECPVPEGWWRVVWPEHTLAARTQSAPAAAYNGDATYHGPYPTEREAQGRNDMSTYTYTIYDAAPQTSGDVAWPHRANIEIAAQSDETAVATILEVLRTEAAGLSVADGYAVGQCLHALVRDESGQIVGEPTYELTEVA